MQLIFCVLMGLRWLQNPSCSQEGLKEKGFYARNDSNTQFVEILYVCISKNEMLCRKIELILLNIQ